MTRFFSAITSRTVQIAVTTSPIRTGALNCIDAPIKIAPAPGSLVPKCAGSGGDLLEFAQKVVDILLGHARLRVLKLGEDALEHALNEPRAVILTAIVNVIFVGTLKPL